jgi:hypothetical protein
VQNEPSNVDLRTLATLPGEPEVTLAELLEWSLANLASLEKRVSAAFLDLSDVKSRLREFKRIAENGSPRLASEIPTGGG